MCIFIFSCSCFLIILCFTQFHIRFANKLRTLPRGTERMPQVDQRHRKATLHWSIHSQGGQDQTETPSYGIDWLQKDLWYGNAKPSKRLSQNVQDIWRSHKVYWTYYGELEGWTKSRKKFNWSENPERYSPGRCAIPIIICDCDDATQSHT